MRATDYLEKNRNNIFHYNDVRKIIDEVRGHRDNFGKIFEYCHENLMIINLCLSELLDVLKDDETYCVLYNLLKSDFDRNCDNSVPYLVDESNIIERYYANLVKEQEKNDLHCTFRPKIKKKGTNI